jgi:hypothetical protein
VPAPRPPDALRVALVERIAHAVRTPGSRDALLRTLDPDHPGGLQELLDYWAQGWPPRHGGWMLRRLAREEAAQLVRLPSAYLLGIVFGLGLPGVYLTSTFDSGLRAFLNWRRFRGGRWRKMQV